MKKLSIITTFLFFVFSPVAARANSIAVSSVAFGAQNTSSHYMPITFNLTWSNAWRDSVNYDAAWVFIKYSTNGGTTWSHATLGPVSGGTAISDGGTGGNLNPTNFSGGTVNVTSSGATSVPLDVIVPTEATSGYKGAFVQITSLSNITGSPSSVYGTITSLSTPVPVQLLWNYATDIGTTSTADQSAATAIVQVFAIEMVYVPTGSFYLGDGTSTSVTGQFCSALSTSTPFQITSQAAMTLGGGGAGSLGNNNASGMATADDWTNSTSVSLPSTYPEGYNAYYIMKYPQTQGQYRDFLNLLTRAQQNSRVYESMSALTSVPTNIYVMSSGGASTPQYRNGIVVTAVPASTSSPMTFGCELNSPVNGSSDGEWVAMNYSYWPDAAAYAAWAGLRPFTEFEYEKASRGPSSVDTGVNGEYAWGTTSITQATSITNSGMISEVAGQTGNGLCVYGSAGSVQGPMRVGMAATSSTTRVQAGASYWGALDMSGNVWQLIVTSGQSLGRGFTGSNGTGVLATDGNATNSDWPGYSSGEVSGETGSGVRGGAWIDASTDERVSDRFDAANSYTTRSNTFGARFARTSP